MKWGPMLIVLALETSRVQAFAQVDAWSGLPAQKLASSEEEKKRWERDDQEAQNSFANGDLEAAERLWRQALGEAEQGRDIDPGVVNCLHNLAILNHRKGDYFESERLYLLTLHHIEALVGKTSPRYADFLPEMAWLYSSHGKDAQAEMAYKKAIEIKEKAFGAEDLRLAGSLDAYARYLRQKDRLPEANTIENRVRQIRQKAAESNLR